MAIVPPACQSDIIRARQKDEFYVDKLRGSILQSFSAVYNIWGFLRSRGFVSLRRGTDVDHDIIETNGRPELAPSTAWSEFRNNGDTSGVPIVAGAVPRIQVDGSRLPWEGEASASHFAARKQAEASFFSDLIYYALSTGLNQRTLGEEYCDILQVTGTFRKPPRCVHRWLLVALQCLPYYLLYRALRFVRERERIGTSGWTLTLVFAASILRVVSRTILPTLRRLNLAFFYLFSRFFLLRFRLANIEYVFVSTSNRPALRHLWLAALLGIQLAMTCFEYFISFFLPHFAACWSLTSRTVHTVCSLIIKAFRMTYSPGLHEKRDVSNLSQGTIGDEANGGAATHHGPLITKAGMSQSVSSVESVMDVALKSDQNEKCRFVDVNQRQDVRNRIKDRKKIVADVTRRMTEMEKRVNESLIAAENDSAVARADCAFCLSPCNTPTATLCGHVFCWCCVSPWCAQNAVCPVCRTSCLPQQLTPLCHYSPSSNLVAAMEEEVYRKVEE